jgi:hypothetical protein
MKKVKLLFTSLMSLGLLVASCGSSGSSDNPPSPTPTPVVVPVTGVSSSEEAFTVVVGQEHSLVYTIAPENATNKKVTVASNSACVGIEGTKVIGSLPGEAQVSLTTEDGNFSVVYTVTVVAELLNVQISGEFKTEYYVGDEFDKTGIVVTANYKDGTSSDVTSEAKFSGFDSSVAGTVAVTASFGGKSASFDVLIKDRVLDNIKVSGDFKNVYHVGDDFDSTGIVVTAYYDDESSKDVTSEASFSGFDSSAAGSVTVTVSYLDKTTSFDVTVKEYKKISFASVVEEYAEKGIEVVIPDYLTDEGELLLEDDVYYITNGSTREEMDLFAASLEAAGWELSVDDYGDYNGVCGNALVYVADYLDYSSHHNAIQIEFSSAAEFPADQIAADLEALGLTDTLPAYSGVAFQYQYSSSETARRLYIVPVDDVDVAIATYQADLLAAGYIEAGEDDYGDMHYASPNDELDVCPWISMYGYIIVDIEIIEHPVPVESVPFDDIVAAFAELGAEVVIPNYEGESLSYLADGVTYYIYGSSEDEMNAFAASMIEAGWLLEQDFAGDYSGAFSETDANVSIVNYLEDEAEAIVVSFSYEASKWPAKEIAEDLALAGVTDELPAYSGEGTGFSYYSGAQGRQVSFVASDSEATAVATYQADLLAAGYTEAGLDDYGDMHYASPNGQIDVVAWKGSDIGYSGYVFIDLELNVVEPSPAEEAINALAQWLDGVPEEIEEGFYYLLSIYEGNQVEGIMEYIPAIYEYALPNFVAEGEWELLEDEYFISFMDENGTEIAHYLSVGTVWVDAEGNLVPEGTEGATESEATILQTYALDASDFLDEFPTDDVEAYLASLGAEVEIPTYVAESADAYFEIDDSDPETFIVYVTGSNADELAAYAALFTEEAGWSVMESDGDYSAVNAELGVYVSMVDFGDYIGLAFFVDLGE